MFKVGLVGVGGISAGHISAWNRMDGAKLVAICDIRPEQLEKYSDVAKYTDFDEKLGNENLDILDICLPKTDAYFNQLRYFTDCVINNTSPDKVKPEELEEVIKILKSF